MNGSAARRARATRIASWAGVLVLVALVVGLGAWRLHGGHWVRVETASMGTEAPVGTLLWVAPAEFDRLRPGDLITFTPPGRGEATYSHLVRSVNADGTISTQGKVTAPDPWRIGPEDVVGKVVLRWPGVGWLVQAAPVLLAGAFVVWILVRRLRDRELRLPAAVIGAALVLTAALAVYRPLTRAEQLSFVPVDGGARATYISTGLLPLRLSAAGADDVVLRDGEVGTVTSTLPTDAQGDSERYAVSLHPAIPRTWWLVLVGCCFAPAAVRLLARRRPAAHAAGRAASGHALATS